MVVRKQFVFTQNKSHQKLISCLHKDIGLVGEENIIAIGYLDLNKAFDKVSHSVLVSKAEKHGCKVIVDPDENVEPEENLGPAIQLHPLTLQVKKLRPRSLVFLKKHSLLVTQQGPWSTSPGLRRRKAFPRVHWSVAH